MAEFPSLPLWTDAWVADTKHLTRLERGTYLDLLVLMWRSPECRVPNDDVWLAKRLGMTLQEVAGELRPLIAEFCQSSGNWLCQKRLTREWMYVAKKRKKNSVAAKSRWNKDKSSSERNAPTPTPTPTPTEEDDDDDARARGRAIFSVADPPAAEPDPVQPAPTPLIKPEATAIATAIASMCGEPDPKAWPPSWCGAPYTVQKWLNAGWNGEHILAGAQEAIGRKRDGPPDRIQYLEKPIASFIARLNAPLPKVEIYNQETIRAAAPTERERSKDNFRAALRELGEFARGGGPDGTALRALPAAGRGGSEGADLGGGVEVPALPDRGGARGV